MASTPDFVTECQFFSTEKQSERGPSARGSFVVGGCLAINFTIWEGRNGHWAALPSEKNPKFDSNQPDSKTNKRSFDQVRPITKDAHALMQGYLLEQYQQAVAGGGGNGGSGGGNSGWQGGGSGGASRVDVPAANGGDDPIPF